MINREAMQKIEQLEKEYARKWGKNVDYMILPKGISQEKLVVVLHRIVVTGESLLVGWDKVNNIR